MSDIQPLGYTPESVEAACRYLKTEAYECLRRVEESLAIVRTQCARTFPTLSDKILGWRSRVDAAASPPDAEDLRLYEHVTAKYNIPPDDELTAECGAERQYSIAIGSVHAHSRMAPCHVETLEYMQAHPPAFHFEVLQRIHALLAANHPSAFKGVGNLSSAIADDLYQQEPMLPKWHTHMRLLLHEEEFMNGVTWPPRVGNVLARPTWSETGND